MADLAFAGDARTALLFVSQPVFSGIIALAMVAFAVAVFRPRRPWLRAALWLLPVAKIVLDVAAACPAAWVGSLGVDLARMKPGARTGMLSVGLTGMPPVLHGSIGMEYDENAPPREDFRTQLARALAVVEAGGSSPQRSRTRGSLHPGDLLYVRIGRTGALALIWLAVGVAVLKVGVRTARLFAFRRWFAGSCAGARPLADVVPELADAGRGWRAPEILVAPGLAVPFATGFLSPRILVPEPLARTLPAPELAALIAHEVAHVRRADPLVRVLLGYLGDVFWYVPGLAGCVARFQAEREADCDDAAHAGAPARLAQALIKTHEWVRERAPAIPGLAPAWAPAAVEASTLSMRLKRLVAPPAESSRAANLAATLAWSYFALVVLESSLAGLS